LIVGNRFYFGSKNRTKFINPAQKGLNEAKNYYKTKKPLRISKKLSVVPAGIEPATQGFSVLCSTN
jgi:hypothetical protein